MAVIPFMYLSEMEPCRRCGSEKASCLESETPYYITIQLSCKNCGNEMERKFRKACWSVEEMRENIKKLWRDNNAAESDL